jgi:hypothetical protein
MKKFTDYVTESFKPQSRRKSIHLGAENTGVMVELISDVDGSQILDTKVEMGSGTLCWISGEAIDTFTKELQDVIDKYKI